MFQAMAIYKSLNEDPKTMQMEVNPTGQHTPTTYTLCQGKQHTLTIDSKSDLHKDS